MLEVKLETPKRLRDDPDALRRWERSAAVVMTRAIAAQVRHRVQDRGETADPYTGPSDFKGKLVSPRYPGAAAAGRPTRSGAIMFASHVVMYQRLGAKPGTFSPSGGWAGLSVHSPSNVHGQASFRGRSEGQDPAFFLYKSGKRKARGRKVSNALKMATVLRATGINPLSITEHEFEAVEAAALAEVAARSVVALGFDVSIRTTAERTDELYRILRAAFASMR